MGEFNIRDLLQTPLPPMRVTPLQFLRVFEVEWLREMGRAEDFKERKFAIQRLANFQEQSSTLQVWETQENEDEVSSGLVATLEAQIIPQKNASFAIQYVLWHLPTDNSRRFLSILDSMEQLPSEASRAVVILNGLINADYRPSLDILELAEKSIKSQRGRSLKREMANPSGGATPTQLAEELLGLNK